MTQPVNFQPLQGQARGHAGKGQWQRRIIPPDTRQQLEGTARDRGECLMHVEGGQNKRLGPHYNTYSTRYVLQVYSCPNGRATVTIWTQCTYMPK